ncbi:hypothetical protein BE11_43735 [Sorangium cellulosum]|nr:hypothetical protein BE11_43735 [Sorangium cellulosum]
MLDELADDTLRLGPSDPALRIEPGVRDLDERGIVEREQLQLVPGELPVAKGDMRAHARDHGLSDRRGSWSSVNDEKHEVYRQGFPRP